MRLDGGGDGVGWGQLKEQGKSNLALAQARATNPPYSNNVFRWPQTF